MAKKIKSNSSLLDELDKPLYEGRWKDIEQALKKIKKKHVIPETFSLFLSGVELLELHLLGPEEHTLGQATEAASVHPDKVLRESETKLKQCVDQCQPGHDASLQQLAKIKLGQLQWLKEEYSLALVALTEVQSTADISLLYTCKVLLEGNLYMGLCYEKLVAERSEQGQPTDKFQAIDAYEESLQQAITLVHSAKEQSVQQHPATFKAIKTVLERGTFLAIEMSSPLRALNLLRHVLQSKEEAILREARLVCTTCLSSLLLFHFSISSYHSPSVSSLSTASPPSHLEEESTLVSLLSKAATDSWNPNRTDSQTTPSPATTFDLLILAFSNAKLLDQMVQTLEDCMRFACDLPHVWLQFALALSTNLQNKQALAVFHECVDLSPKDPLILCTAAKFALEKASRPDLCLKWAQMASECVGKHFLRPRVEFLLGRGFTLQAEQESSSSERGELLKKGVTHLMTAAQLDDNNVEFSFHYALRKAESRDLAAASAEVKRALGQNAGHTSCLHLLALILSAQKHYSEALQVCDFALQKQPENFGLLECKTKLEIVTKGTQEALKTCKHALKLWQKLFSNEVTGLIGIVTQEHQSLSNIPHTIREQSEQQHPDDIASDAGSSHFSLSASQTPTNQPNLLQAKIWCTIAEVFISAEKVSDAMSCIQEAQYLGPYLPSVLTTHGRILELENRTEDALKAYFNALSLQPSNPIALTLVGRLLHTLERDMEAEKYLREATSADQLNHEAWFWLGEVFSAQEQFELSSECFKTSLELESSTPIQPFSAVLSSFIPSS